MIRGLVLTGIFAIGVGAAPAIHAGATPVPLPLNSGIACQW